MAQGWKHSLYQKLITLAVRFKWLRQTSYGTDELHPLIFNSLPQTFQLPMPKGTSQLTLLEGQLSIPSEGQKMKLHFLADFTVDLMANRIYQAHLDISLSAEIYYDPQRSTLYLREITLEKNALISDNYALIKDSKELLNSLLPSPVRGLLSVTMDTTMGLIGDSILGDFHQYLSLYIAGNKQKVLDHHQGDMERAIIEYAREGKLQYCMDPNDFEENLFAQYGQSVKLEQGRLHFIFSE